MIRKRCDWPAISRYLISLWWSRTAPSIVVFLFYSPPIYQNLPSRSWKWWKRIGDPCTCWGWFLMICCKISTNFLLNVFDCFVFLQQITKIFCHYQFLLQISGFDENLSPTILEILCFFWNKFWVSRILRKVDALFLSKIVAVLIFRSIFFSV